MCHIHDLGVFSGWPYESVKVETVPHFCPVDILPTFFWWVGLSLWRIANFSVTGTHVLDWNFWQLGALYHGLGPVPPAVPKGVRYDSVIWRILKKTIIWEIIVSSSLKYFPARSADFYFVHGYFSCMYVCTLCMPGTHERPEEVQDNCKWSRECWDQS